MSEFVQIEIQLSRSSTVTRAPTGRSTAVFWLQGITLIWMLVECGLSLYAAAAARSPALLAFGSDSFVELLSAGVVLLQFLPQVSISQRNAARAAGALLFALALIVCVVAIGASSYRHSGGFLTPVDDGLVHWVCTGHQRKVHLGIVDQTVVPPGLQHPAQIVVSEGYAEVFGAFIPRRIDNEIVRANAPGVRNRVRRHPSVDRVTLHVHIEVGLPKRKCRGVAEAFARAPHPDSAWQCSVFE